MQVIQDQLKDWRKSIDHCSFWFNIFRLNNNDEEYSYIFNYFSDPKHALNTLLGIHKFLVRWLQSLDNVLIKQIEFLIWYNQSNDNTNRHGPKINEYILNSVQTDVHNNVINVYNMAQQTDVWLQLGFVIHSVISDLYGDNYSSPIKNIGNSQTDSEVPINSFDCLGYLDIIWGHTEDLFFSKWGTWKHYDDWIVSAHVNHFGSQILQYLVNEIESKMKDLMKYQ